MHPCKALTSLICNGEVYIGPYKAHARHAWATLLTVEGSCGWQGPASLQAKGLKVQLLTF